jgi:transcriptional regulator with XRE-family HTH domain
MAIPYEQVLAEESEETQLWVKQRAAELIAEELNLRQLRRLRKLTQARLAKKLNIGQEGVSRIEKRSDLYLSTLRGYLAGVGGELILMVRFPDQPPVLLAGLGESAGEDEGETKGKRKARTAAKSNGGTRRAA